MRKRKRRSSVTPRVILWDKKLQARAELAAAELAELVDQARHLVEDLMVLKANSQRKKRVTSRPAPDGEYYCLKTGLDGIAPIVGCRCDNCEAARARGLRDNAAREDASS